MNGSIVNRFMDAVSFINRGGFINWVIIALYMVVIGIACERASYFFRTRYRKKQFRNELSVKVMSLSNGLDIPWAASVCRSQPARMVEVFIQNIDRSGVALSEVLDREGKDLRSSMDRGIEVLSMVGNIAPLCGLFGTITGLMTAFGKIEALGGAVDMASLSGGIWEAMITTATGLAVAIPSVMLCRIFERIAEHRTTDMEYAVSLMTETLREDCLVASTSESCSINDHIREMS